MIQRSILWRVGAVLFLVINVGGAVVALAEGELLHASIHIGLLLPSAYLMRFAWRRDAFRSRGEGSVIPALGGELDDRLTHLEQSLDAVAIEVERIGEGQRFMTRLFTDNAALRAPGERAAEPIEIKKG